MIHIIMTVHDSKVEAYLQPFFAQTPQAGVRTITDLVNTEGHPFNLHPEDYTLMIIGRYHDDTATIEVTGQLEGVCNLIELQKETKS